MTYRAAEGGKAMLGAAIGVVSGGVAFFLLRRFCRAVSGEGRIPALLALLNPLTLLAGMGLAAIICPGELIWTGTGMAAFLIAGAMGEGIMALRSAKKNSAAESRGKEEAER